MVYGLSKDEKIQLILSRMRNVQINKYNAYLSLLEEQALPSPRENYIESTNDTISIADAQLAALQQEYDTVEQAE